jgi:hypothetical protein
VFYSCEQASLVKPQESAALADNGLQTSSTSQLGSQAPSKGLHHSTVCMFVTVYKMIPFFF